MPSGTRWKSWSSASRRRAPARRPRELRRLQVPGAHERVRGRARSAAGLRLPARPARHARIMTAPARASLRTTTVTDSTTRVSSGNCRTGSDTDCSTESSDPTDTKGHPVGTVLPIGLLASGEQPELRARREVPDQPGHPGRRHLPARQPVLALAGRRDRHLPRPVPRPDRTPLPTHQPPALTC